MFECSDAMKINSSPTVCPPVSIEEFNSSIMKCVEYSLGCQVEPVLPMRVPVSEECFEFNLDRIHGQITRTNSTYDIVPE